MCERCDPCALQGATAVNPPHSFLFVLSLFVPSLVSQVYREIRQALVDMETMFALQSVKASIVDAPDAKPLELTRGGNIDFEDVCFSFKERNILKGAVWNNLTLAAGMASDGSCARE